MPNRWAWLAAAMLSPAGPATRLARIATTQRTLRTTARIAVTPAQERGPASSRRPTGNDRLTGHGITGRWRTSWCALASQPGHPGSGHPPPARRRPESARPPRRRWNGSGTRDRRHPTGTGAPIHGAPIGTGAPTGTGAPIGTGAPTEWMRWTPPRLSVAAPLEPGLAAPSEPRPCPRRVRRGKPRPCPEVAPAAPAAGPAPAAAATRGPLRQAPPLRPPPRQSRPRPRCTHIRRSSADRRPNPGQSQGSSPQPNADNDFESQPSGGH